MQRTTRHLILLAFALLPSAQGQADVLARLANSDLSKASPQDLQRLDVMVGRGPKAFVTGPIPWNVWKTSEEGQTRYVVFLGKSLEMIPGESLARV